MSGTRDPFEPLFATIAPSINASYPDGAFVRSLFVSRRLRKGEFYQRSGQVTTHGGFVVRGCLRTYAIAPDGTESIMYFSPERTWVGDIQSARTRRPTAYDVDAIEPAELLVIALPDFDRLLARAPDVAQGYQLGLERLSAARDRRIALALNSTAEERYVDFVKRNPSIATNVRSTCLPRTWDDAETLSRVRRKRRGP
jgi:CRP-like cAMP-binding protein